MGGNTLVKNTLVLGIIASLLFVNVIPSSMSINVKQISLPTSSGNTLYVGGSGPGNYSKIQDAINDSSDGDTVYVYDESSPYYEYNISIPNSINLLGENKNTTIIDSNKKGDVVVINNTNYVSICGFTIKNGKHSDYYGSGINILNSNDILIFDNNIFDNERGGIDITEKCTNVNIIKNNISKNKRWGIHCERRYDFEVRNCVIKDNIVTNNSYAGIRIDNAINGLFIGNTVTNNGIGIEFYYRSALGHHNIVTNNIISDNKDGIYIDNEFGFGERFTTIEYNTISNNEIGVHIYDTLKNTIKYNNFIGNIEHGFYECNGLPIVLRIKNKWINNYYSGWPFLRPKPIPGIRWYEEFVWPEYIYWSKPWIPLFDWFPAQEPYDIGV